MGLSGLSYNTTYYWHARAENGFGTTYANSSPTAFWSFTTGEATGGVSVFNVWTADMHDIPKVTFGPGEGIRYYLAADNTTGSTATAYFEWHVSGSCGTVVDWTGNLDTDAGLANWFIETTTPTDCPGPYTFEGSVTYNAVKTTDSTGFDVAYHLYTPMIVHQ